MTGGPRLDKIDRNVLTPFVQEVLGTPEIEIADWEYEIIKGDWTPDKRLVCRLFGRGWAQDREISWSLFLKVPNPVHTHMDSWHREPFQREPLLYGSGILDDLPGHLCAPRCLGVVEYPDDEPWMWLEDVAGEPSLEWPLERFGLAARHFGVFQGAFLAGAPLPDEPWLDTSGWLKPRFARSFEWTGPILERFRDHPLTERIYRSDLGERLERLWAEREVFQDVLERMPRTFCHGDFSYTNLMTRRLPDGADQTVVIDWQYAGVRPIGEDIAGLIADSSVIPVRRTAAEPEVFAELILEPYLEGLREGGWTGDLRIPRLACLAMLALPWTLNLLLGLNGLLREPLMEEVRTQTEEKLDEYVRRQEFLFGLAEEARGMFGIVA